MQYVTHLKRRQVEFITTAQPITTLQRLEWLRADTGVSARTIDLGLTCWQAISVDVEIALHLRWSSGSARRSHCVLSSLNSRLFIQYLSIEHRYRGKGLGLEGSKTLKDLKGTQSYEERVRIDYLCNFSWEMCPGYGEENNYLLKTD